MFKRYHKKMYDNPAALSPREWTKQQKNLKNKKVQIIYLVLVFFFTSVLEEGNKV